MWTAPSSAGLEAIFLEVRFGAAWRPTLRDARTRVKTAKRMGKLPAGTEKPASLGLLEGVVTPVRDE
jgi:hypothetical protein